MEIGKKELEKVLETLEKVVVFLPLLTAVAYVGAYFFEMAYLGFYDIPSQFIQIKTENFIFLLLATTFVGVGGLVLYDVYQQDLRHRSKRQKVFAFSALGIILAFLLLFGLPPFMVTSLVVAAIVVGLFGLFVPKHLQDKSRTKDRPMPQKIMELVFPVFVIVLLFSYMTGRLWAISREDYAVVELRQGKYAVVQSYGDSRLLVRAEKNSKHDFLVLSFDDLSGHQLRIEKLELGGLDWDEWVKVEF